MGMDDNAIVQAFERAWKKAGSDRIGSVIGEARIVQRGLQAIGFEMFKAGMDYESGASVPPDTSIDFSDSPVAWFVVLERARMTGDDALVLKAHGQLSRLGVDISYRDGRRMQEDKWPGPLWARQIQTKQRRSDVSLRCRLCGNWSRYAKPVLWNTLTACLHCGYDGK